MHEAITIEKIVNACVRSLDEATGYANLKCKAAEDLIEVQLWGRRTEFDEWSSLDCDWDIVEMCEIFFENRNEGSNWSSFDLYMQQNGEFSIDFDEREPVFFDGNMMGDINEVGRE